MDSITGMLTIPGKYIANYGTRMSKIFAFRQCQILISLGPFSRTGMHKI